MKEIICIECPIGCRININENGDISNYKCKKGINYVLNEIKNPLRSLTTTVKTVGFKKRRVAVRVDKEIPKDMIFPVLKEIKKLRISKKIKINEILIENILNLGVNVISTESLDED